MPLRRLGMVLLRGNQGKKNGLGHLEELLKVREDLWCAPMLFDLV